MTEAVRSRNGFEFAARKRRKPFDPQLLHRAGQAAAQYRVFHRREIRKQSYCVAVAGRVAGSPLKIITANSKTPANVISDAIATTGSICGYPVSMR